MECCGSPVNQPWARPKPSDAAAPDGPGDALPDGAGDPELDARETSVVVLEVMITEGSG